MTRSKRSLERRIEELEEDECGDRDLEDLPEILMNNLREEYGYDQ